MQMFKAAIAALFILLLCNQIAAIVSAKPSGQEELGTFFNHSSKNLSFLRTEGDRILNENGTPVTLRGVNIGSWLLIEPWIIGVEGDGILAEDDIWDKMRNNLILNDSQRDLLRVVFRDSWFTKDDACRIKETGMNCIRLPLRYHEVNSDGYNETLNYTDQCIDWCKINRLYVILDLHSAPGGQNSQTQNTGNRSYINQLWTNGTYQSQTVQWWKEISKKYKNEPTIAGYDLINEAMPGEPDNLEKSDFDKMIELYDEIYNTVRNNHDNHTIILEATMLSHYLPLMPSPVSRNWTNVVYSFHYYPQGLNFSQAYEKTQIYFPQLQAMAMQYGVPILVGEFNTREKDTGGVDLFKLYCDIFDYYGWSWTFWTFKKIESDPNSNHGLYGYVNCIYPLNFSDDSFGRIETAFRGMRSEHTGNLSMVLASPKWGRPTDQINEEIDLTVREATFNGSLRVEWKSNPNLGYWGSYDWLVWKFGVKESGIYTAALCMAKENATESKAAIWVNGVLVNEISLKDTGGWDRYENNSLGQFDLSAGNHTLAISQADSDHGTSFLNVRSLSLKRTLGNKSLYNESPIYGKEIKLNPVNVEQFQPNTSICIEWLNNPPNFGYWKSGNSLSWNIQLDLNTDQPVNYSVKVEYASPKDTKLNISVDGRQPFKLANLSKTTEDPNNWSTYKTVDIGPLPILEIEEHINVTWDSADENNAGNLRRIQLYRQR